MEQAQSRLDGIETRLASLEQRLASLEQRPGGPVYLGDHLALVQTRWGAKMAVDTRDQLLAPWLLLDGLWETHVTGWLDSVLQPGAVMVDVGANVGYFTLLGARRVGSTGRVVAVEAHPALYDLLRRNVVMNGHQSTVTLWNRAAWSAPERLQFHQRVRYAANSSLATAGTDGLDALGDTEEIVEVDAAPLDDLLEPLGRVDVIKVDVEGAEVHAFRGLGRTMAANPGLIIMFEWSPEQIRQMGDDPKDLLALLDGAGFHFGLLEEGLATVEAARLLEVPYGNVVARR